MRTNLNIPVAALTGFLLVLSRILGVFVYLPLPGKDAGPSMARVVLAFSTALAIYPSWSKATSAANAEPSDFFLWIFSELAFGLTIGILVSFLTEALTVGAHILALQAGYAYASVVDPTTQADSEILQILSQLVGGLLFFGLGLDHLALLTFTQSLQSVPPGHFAISRHLALAVMNLSANLFSMALKLALPTVALLLTTEVALAMVGRLSTQLQLGSNSTSIKMLLTLLMLVAALRITPQLYEVYAGEIFEFIRSTFWVHVAP